MIKMTILALAVFFGYGLFAPLCAQTAQDQQKAMEAYMKAGAVTENHAVIKRMAGSWTAKTTMWAVPGQPPTDGGGEIEGRMIMGGRFVALDFRGTMMGQPFEGLQITGYDNMQKKYLTLWIDNTSTSFFMLAGTRDAKADAITQMGDWAEPMGGTSKVRAVTRFLGPDEFIFEQYMVLPDGKEFKSMEMRCARRT